MDEMKMAEDANLEYFYKLLLNRFKVMRQQENSTQRQSEEERIELAFNRIRWGNYQACMECGGDIENKCLMNDPTITICLKCIALPEK